MYFYFYFDNPDQLEEVKRAMWSSERRAGHDLTPFTQVGSGHAECRLDDREKAEYFHAICSHFGFDVSMSGEPKSPLWKSPFLFG